MVTWGGHGKLNTDANPSSRLKPEPRSREAATLSAVPLFHPETLTREDKDCGYIKSLVPGNSSTRLFFIVYINTYNCLFAANHIGCHFLVMLIGMMGKK